MFFARLPGRRRAAGLVARLSRAAGAPGRQRRSGRSARMVSARPAGAVGGASSARWSSPSRSRISAPTRKASRPACAAAFERDRCAIRSRRADARQQRPDRLIDFLVIAVPPAAAVLATIDQPDQSLARRPHREILRPAAPALAATCRRCSLPRPRRGAARRRDRLGLPAGGLLGMLASVFAASLLMAFAMLGFAVLHAITRGMRQPRRSCSAASMRRSIVFGWPVAGAVACSASPRPLSTCAARVAAQARPAAACEPELNPQSTQGRRTTWK